MNAFCSKIFGAHNPRMSFSNGEKKRKPKSLRLESLEDRKVFASVSGGVLYIEGSSAADVVTVSTTGGTSKYSTPLRYSVNHNGIVQSFSMFEVSSGQIRFNGNAGNDTFTNNTSLSLYASGGTGDDILIGGSSDDVLIGDSGIDRLFGNGGNDALFGDTPDGTSTNALNQQMTADPNLSYSSQLANQRTSDVDKALRYLASNTPSISGGSNLSLSRITIYRAPGNDFLYGGEGTDRLYGNGGNDTLYGGNGVDYLYGENGNDILYGENGNDFLAGGIDDDQLYGGMNNDVLAGEQGRDLLLGEGGDDHLGGGDGVDRISETANIDMLLTDWDLYALGHDTLVSIEEAKLTGGSLNNRLDARGFSGDVELYGDGGNDVLLGGLGNDRLFGGQGNDWLEAGSAEEFVDGGTGTNYNAHEWAIFGTAADDINQQQSGTCVILAAAASAVNRGVDLASQVTYVGDFTYQVSMFDADAGWVTIPVYFDGNMISDSAGNQMDPGLGDFDAGGKVSEFWPILYQRAYVSYFRGTDPLDGNAVAALGGEPSHERAIAAVTGRATDNVSLDSGLLDLIGDDYLYGIGYALSSLVTYGSVVTVGGTGHAYAVMSAYYDVDGVWKALLYNPWGTDATHQPMPFDGLSASDGILLVSVDTLIRNFEFINYSA